jgi:Domain of unknown function (DUF4365)
MTTLLRKMRTREHVLADLSLNHLERHILLSDGIVSRPYRDYGYDFMLTSFNALGEVEAGYVFFQLKATDDLPLLADGETISWPISRRDLLLWLDEACPVILVVYDGKRDRAFWLDIQAYFAGRPSAELFLAGQTINAHLRLSDRVNRRSIREIIRRKNAARQRPAGKEFPNA